jgi:hypothetical protein
MNGQNLLGRPGAAQGKLASGRRPRTACSGGHKRSSAPSASPSAVPSYNRPARGVFQVSRHIPLCWMLIVLDGPPEAFTMLTSTS